MSTGSMSDGYHTFDELYDHRITLFAALCRKLSYRGSCWISKFHADGTMFEGWFIAGIGKKPGYQITYHIPLGRWHEFVTNCEELERAPEWDGHTPADVIERLKGL